MALRDYEALIQEDPADKEYSLQHASLANYLPSSASSQVKRTPPVIANTIDAESSKIKDANVSGDEYKSLPLQSLPLPQDAIASSGKVQEYGARLRYKIIRPLAKGGLALFLLPSIRNWIEKWH